ncbi:MAG: acyl-CoA reductase [Bacteroidota bacterium]
MNLEERIGAFVELGLYIKNLDRDELDLITDRATAENTWFTKDNVVLALEGIAQFLDRSALENWVAGYTPASEGKNVGLVMAGNIPLVGFHDMLCILISGHKLSAKLSSKDQFLIKHMAEKLIQINPAFQDLISFPDMLKGIDAVIATGSDNSSRYFDHYFSKYPNIIRKNRTSCAVLDGQETEDDYKSLGKDIFQYFGLGCRNVSKVYTPEDFDWKKLIESLSEFDKVLYHHKYSNNYDYNKSIYLVNKVDHLDTGFLLVTESDKMVSPISVLFYETYKDIESLRDNLEHEKSKIQCIVAKAGLIDHSVNFGQSQLPQLSDYADGVDTMSFLSEIGQA